MSLFSKIVGFIMTKFSLFVFIVLNTCYKNLLRGDFLTLHEGYVFYVFVLHPYLSLYEGYCLIDEAYVFLFILESIKME